MATYKEIFDKGNRKQRRAAISQIKKIIKKQKRNDTSTNTPKSAVGK